MNYRRFVATLFALYLGAGSAQATLIEADWQSAGDHLITMDTLTGLAWLDVTVTQGKSVREVVGLLQSDARYASFRYATEGEFLHLAEDAGIPVRDGHAVPENFAPVMALIDLVGRTLDVSPALVSSLGIVEDPLLGPAIWPVDSFHARPVTSDASVLVDNAFFPPDGANPSVGSWLVAPRGDWQVPTLPPPGDPILVPIPVPAPLFLIVFGLLLLARQRRQG